MTRSASVVLLVVVVSSVVGIASLAFSGGVFVVVQNKGPEVIDEVTVHVTGNSYDVGTLKPGQARKVRVTPKGESHVEIAFLDSSLNPHRVVAECYLEEHHYKGTITVDIAGNEAKRVDERLELSIF